VRVLRRSPWVAANSRWTTPNRPTDPAGLDYAGSARAALRQLDEGYEAWIADVCSLGVAGITRPQEVLAYVHVEVIHHGAEICLLRDLYAWRSRLGLVEDD
jgi:hypothetical protein